MSSKIYGNTIFMCVIKSRYYLYYQFVYIFYVINYVKLFKSFIFFRVGNLFT